MAYEKDDDKLIAAAVVFNAVTMKVIESAIAVDIERFPYIPGLFSFRKLPSLIKAIEKISTVLDLIGCVGQGTGHLRRFGLACHHLGILFDLPSIGCSKTRLIGVSDEPEETRGSFTPIIDKNEVIGNILCRQKNNKPLYIIFGHKISFGAACNWILKLAPRYRLPETTRLSD